MSDLRQLKYVWRRLVCVLKEHDFSTRDNHVTCNRCNWCGGAAGAEADFSVPLGTGMTPTQASDLPMATVRRLENRLAEFDAVRARGEVESRTRIMEKSKP